MMIQLEMGPEFKRTAQDMSNISILKAASTGLAKGGHIAAGTVVRDYLSGQSLKRRTGLLAKTVSSWMAGDTEVVIGVPENSPASKYAFLLSDEEKTITPKNAKFLTIPIGEGLTPSGVPRYSSPRDVEGGFFLKSKSGQLLFGYKRGKKGKFRPLFVLVKSVLVQGTGALYDGVMDSMDDITGSMQDELDKIPGVDS